MARDLRGQLPGGLDELLDDDVVFYSPIVYTPQGQGDHEAVPASAGQTLPGDPTAGRVEPGDGGGFRYTKTVLTGDTAVLEFETTVEGKYVNGVDIIRCNDAGRIVEIRVMIRPLQAINLVHQPDGGDARTDEATTSSSTAQPVLSGFPRRRVREVRRAAAARR